MRPIFFRIVIILNMIIWSHYSMAQITNYKAYSIFIYSFSKYINWPPELNEGDFVITVIGKSKVTDELILMAEKKNVGGRKIVVKQVENAAQMDFSHIVFLPEGKSTAIEEVTAKIGNKPMLIVSERDGLIRKGACISFIVLEDNSLRFEVDEDTLHTHQLKAAKSLLALAYKE